LLFFEKLSLFSREWLEICSSEPNIPHPNEIPDPNGVPNPNCLCFYADFSKDNEVNANDLDLFNENWPLTNL
jgi:hypothetical protein